MVSQITVALIVQPLSAVKLRVMSMVMQRARCQRWMMVAIISIYQRFCGDRLIDKKIIAVINNKGQQ
jgi:hypothetical protein